MSWKLFFSTYALVFAAELPDKTAIATLVLATRGKPLPTFAGIALAFAIQSTVAVVFGKLAGSLAARWMPPITGLLFLAFAVAYWLRSRSPEEKPSDAEQSDSNSNLSAWKTAAAAFMVIFIAEWGDLTQLASASLAARSNAPWTIFTASVLALWTVTALAIALGGHAAKYFRPALLSKIAAAAMATVGVFFLVAWAFKKS